MEQYKYSFPVRMKCLEQDLEECLTALKFPVESSLTFRGDNPREGIAHPEDEIIRLHDTLGFEITDIIHGN